MGRPKSTAPRCEQLNLSFTLGELQSIRDRASALGQRPAYFARVLLLDKRTTFKSAHPSHNHARLVHHQLIRLGNNLNQIVRVLHQTGAPLPNDLEPLLVDIRALIAKLGK